MRHKFFSELVYDFVNKKVRAFAKSKRAKIRSVLLNDYEILEMNLTYDPVSATVIEDGPIVLSDPVPVVNCGDEEWNRDITLEERRKVVSKLRLLESMTKETTKRMKFSISGKVSGSYGKFLSAEMAAAFEREITEKVTEVQERESNFEEENEITKTERITEPVPPKTVWIFDIVSYGGILNVPCTGGIILDADVEILHRIKNKPFGSMDFKTKVKLSRLYPSPSDRKMMVDEEIVYTPSAGGPRKRPGSFEKFCSEIDEVVHRAIEMQKTSNLGKVKQDKVEIIPFHPDDVESDEGYFVVTFLGNAKKIESAVKGRFRYEVMFDDGMTTEGTATYSTQGQERFFLQARLGRRKGEKIVGIKVTDEL